MDGFDKAFRNLKAMDNKVKEAVEKYIEMDVGIEYSSVLIRAARPTFGNVAIIKINDKPIGEIEYHTTSDSTDYIDINCMDGVYEGAFKRIEKELKSVPEKGGGC